MRTSFRLLRFGRQFFFIKIHQRLKANNEKCAYLIQKVDFVQVDLKKVDLNKIDLIQVDLDSIQLIQVDLNRMKLIQVYLNRFKLI